jgi:hypothetical protein
LITFSGHPNSFLSVLGCDSMARRLRLCLFDAQKYSCTSLTSYEFFSAEGRHGDARHSGMLPASPILITLDACRIVVETGTGAESNYVNGPNTP